MFFQDWSWTPLDSVFGPCLAISICLELFIEDCVGDVFSYIVHSIADFDCLKYAKSCSLILKVYQLSTLAVNLILVTLCQRG